MEDSQKKDRNNIAIFGLGRVGLPLALSFAEAGDSVIGVDINEKRISDLEKRVMPFIEEGADPLLKRHVGKSFIPTLDSRYAIKNSDYLILTLGTPIDEKFNPVFSYIDKFMEGATPHLGEGKTLILRSTVTPGTTERLARNIERKTSLKVGKNIYVAHCPERLIEGKAIEEIREIPQIIGALDKESKLKAKRLFSKLTDKILLTDTRSSELAKLFTNMYRYINFAIGNEFMVLAQEQDRDIYEILRLVNKGYKRGGLMTPGLTAGPCLFKDGFFLLRNNPFSDLITTSWRINETIPGYLIDEVKSEIDLEGEKVALLGMAFKADIDDFRESLSYKASNVHTHDPYLKGEELDSVLDGSGVVFLAVAHSAYKHLDENYLRERVKSGCLVVDIWNHFNKGKILFKIDGKR
jgi:UDP-N-acetyl-D-mannosaminuronic acid dehydrogenase